MLCMKFFTSKIKDEMGDNPLQNCFFSTLHKSLLNTSGLAFPSPFKYFAVTAIAITVVPVAAMIGK